ncbi:hypothetical protein [Paenibacillus eucommiae]|uniref:Uncharacterized protein n=1 Tax=Paenibacillus eucommiae TaxID=1355755 RepID=A0ABS4IQM4_9BACL|nr:hypothetical protein [Paenibacillus eucommiae]MBP1989871.1 hypothetical protein [Paenibacillus eucommiae]
MHTVTSRDGTQIAYDKVGKGPAVILVAGAFSYRKYPGQVQLANLLSEHLQSTTMTAAAAAIAETHCPMT